METFGNDNKHILSLLTGVLVLADTHLELAPYLKTVVPGALHVPFPQSTAGYVFLWEDSEAKGFAAAHAVV